MKKFIIIFVLILGSIPVYSLTFLEYLAHCNVSLGPNFMAGGDISGDNAAYSIWLSDNHGPIYYYDYSPSDIKKPVGISFDTRLPFYFNDLFALGLNIELGGFNYMSGLIGAYFDYYFSPRWSFVGSIGGSLALISYKLGEANGKDVTLSGSGTSGLGLSLGAKFHVFKYMYLEAGYRLGWASKISEYSVRYDGEKVGNLPLPPLKASASHNFSIKIGAGI
ncbi:hypothetical protein [Leadbettera azotonutricia]|uniref:Uncharacterized protein n=1 Tax=Leadbettera azotonutricia (strain ATCC BAA-888 / DSM 13862 / ZAS-9) TaxID=545695 RepID=F5YCA7_LEAAZ|nr:hypothetical protein [Leadbettera azotonutricia]AEF82315.1 hypothetical protein TREAZ_0462 [Leadbettera azotonutricia ZAS-9]